MGSVSKDVIADQLTTGKRRGRNQSKAKTIVQLDPKTKTAVLDVFEKMRRAEAWNTMVYMDRPGWQGKAERNVGEIVELLKTVSPAAYEAFKDRVGEAKIQQWDRVKSQWPNIETRMLRKYVAPE
jgi:hypothetical protein